MKYLMLIYGNEKIWNSLPPTDIAELIREVDAFNAELNEIGEGPSAGPGWPSSSTCST